MEAPLQLLTAPSIIYLADKIISKCEDKLAMLPSDPHGDSVRESRDSLVVSGGPEHSNRLGDSL